MGIPGQAGICYISIMRILRRIIAMGPRETAVFILSRFWIVRRLDWLLRSAGRPDLVKPDENDFVATGEKASSRALSEDGLLTGIRLSSETLSRLNELAATAGIFPIGAHVPQISDIESLEEFNRTSDRPVCKAGVLGAELDELCGRIARNPALLKLVRQKIGAVRTCKPMLEWSLVVTADDEWRETQHQTVKFHYDVFGLNFVFVFFYLTACDRNSGAHEIVLRSHYKKPLRMLLSSVRRDEQELRRHYGDGNFVVVEGDAGFGFIEDTSCYHRARAPVTSPRLALQIRYSS